ncbi:unnamed protein product [Menidia menidia]|uniref:(Atlantic silverside) hypothetical protein n=1 Tax=Menidia menidia TaxID=238744 RepID=A0A8S4B2G4_9TELE|nr:unnamed protein product [Menidia menidia]
MVERKEEGRGRQHSAAGDRTATTGRLFVHGEKALRRAFVKHGENTTDIIAYIDVACRFTQEYLSPERVTGQALDAWNRTGSQSWHVVVKRVCVIDGRDHLPVCYLSVSGGDSSQRSPLSLRVQVHLLTSAFKIFTWGCKMLALFPLSLWLVGLAEVSGLCLVLSSEVLYQVGLLLYHLLQTGGPSGTQMRLSRDWTDKCSDQVVSLLRAAIIRVDVRISRCKGEAAEVLNANGTASQTKQSLGFLAAVATNRSSRVVGGEETVNSSVVASPFTRTNLSIWTGYRHTEEEISYVITLTLAYKI